jgi:Ca2+-binding EF-hand superfamily protein
MAADAEAENPWPYLESKYDADHDGRVTAEEYDRSRASFDRLDRDGDAAITEEDFTRSGRDMAAMRRGMMGQMVMATSFHTDDDANELSLRELEAAIDAYDANNDGTVTAGEFRDTHDERYREPAGSDMMSQMMRDVDPWDTLAEAADGDDDGALSDDELVAFFRSRDSDGNDMWTLNRGSRGGRGGRGGPPPEEEMSGPRVGTMAPDFTLTSPHGGAPVTLSSFREKNLPVALIFGSYT